MKGTRPESRFILCCTQRQLLGLLLLIALPGIATLGCGWLMEDLSVAQIAWCGFGSVWLLATGWLITALALSAHTGFYWAEANLPEDWP
jgi:hypothetical protein